MCFAECVLFFTTESKVKMLMEPHGEENSVAVDWRARRDFSGEGISEPSLNSQRGQPCLEPHTTFQTEAMGTLQLMNTGLAVCRGAWRKTAGKRMHAVEIVGEQVEVGLALTAAQGLRHRRGGASRDRAVPYPWDSQENTPGHSEHTCPWSQPPGECPHVPRGDSGTERPADGLPPERVPEVSEPTPVCIPGAGRGFWKEQPDLG